MTQPIPAIQPPPLDTTIYTDGLLALSDGVRRYFQYYSVQADVLPVGLKSRSLWARPRVIFIDGEFDGTLAPKSLKAGRLAPAEHTKSDNPRELYTWERVCTACVFAFDMTQPHSEEAQIQAATSLLNMTIRAMYNAFDPKIYGPDPETPGPPGTKEFGFAGQASLHFEDGSVTRVYPPVEIAAGVELLVVFTQRSPLFDAPIPIVTATPILTKSFSPPSP